MDGRDEPTMNLCRWQRAASTRTFAFDRGAWAGMLPLAKPFLQLRPAVAGLLDTYGNGTRLLAGQPTPSAACSGSLGVDQVALEHGVVPGGDRETIAGYSKLLLL